MNFEFWILNFHLPRLQLVRLHFFLECWILNVFIIGCDFYVLSTTEWMDGFIKCVYAPSLSSDDGSFRWSLSGELPRCLFSQRTPSSIACGHVWRSSPRISWASFFGHRIERENHLSKWAISCRAGGRTCCCFALFITFSLWWPFNQFDLHLKYLKK